MKNLFFAVLTLSFFTVATNAQSTYKVDASHSSLVFSVGYNYSDFYGSFGEMEGEATLKDEKDFSTAEVTFSTQIASINTNSKGRDGNLQKERYFNAEKNPAASFTSKHIKPLGDNKYEMTGDFTLGGVTLSQTVMVHVKGQGVIGEGEDQRSIMGVKVTFSFNRSNFGITGGIPTMSDKIDIIASLHMVKK